MSLVNAVTLENQLTDFVKSIDINSSYDQLSNISTDPILFSELQKKLTVLIQKNTEKLHSVNNLVGVELGGVPYVSQLSINLDKPYIIFKNKTKGYGTDKLIEGTFQSGENIILVMHTITDTVLEHCTVLLKQHHLNCILCVGLISQFSAKYPFPIKSVFESDD